MESFKLVIEAMKNAKDIVKFTFSDNYNTTGFDYGWKLISDTLSSFKKLTYLNLSYSYMSDKYLAIVIKAIIDCPIVFIDFSSNFITSAGAEMLSDYIKTKPKMETIILQQNTTNEFGKDGVSFISNALITLKNIEVLDISYMIITGFSDCLDKFIRGSSSLKELKVRNTRMNLSDFENITEAVLANKSMSILNIGLNNTGVSKSVLMICKLIEKDCKLIALNIDDIGLEEETSLRFLEALSANKQIKQLSMRDNIEFPLYTKLIELVASKDYFELLSINLNKLDKAVQEKVKVILSKTKGLSIK